MEKQRYVFLEILRIVACFLVIVNHTNSEIFLSCGPSGTWFLSLTYFFICKVAVPIFIMISGYTMLHKQDDYKKVLQRMLRIGGVLLLFSLVYYIDDFVTGVRTTIGVKDFLITIFNSHITNAFWYLYMYLGLLLMLPFLQKFVSVLSKKDLHIFFGISGLVFATWPIIEHVAPSLQYSDYFMIPLFDSYIFMLLAGYYIRKYMSPSKKLCFMAAVLFVLACIFNVGMTYLEYYKTAGGWYLFLDDRTYLPILLESVCLFYMVSCVKTSEKWGLVFKIVGGCTFGIYLLSDLFIEKFRVVYDTLVINGMHQMLAVVIFEVVVFLAGLGITFVLKRIPVLKKLV